MQSKLFSILFCCAVSNLLASCKYNEPDSVIENGVSRRTILLQKADSAFLFCKKNKMDTTFCLLADMKMHSGKIRFFLFDFQTKSILDSGMVSHGCGANPWGKTSSKYNSSFSNKDGSHCTSLGKFKIGQRNYSQWGIHVNYFLYGLEVTNNNAYKRTIVLHSWDDVPEGEVYPDGTPEGWGCPAINNSLMERIDQKLQLAKSAVLLWQFYD